MWADILGTTTLELEFFFPAINLKHAGTLSSLFELGIQGRGQGFLYRPPEMRIKLNLGCKKGSWCCIGKGPLAPVQRGKEGCGQEGARGIRGLSGTYDVAIPSLYMHTTLTPCILTSLGAASLVHDCQLQVNIIRVLHPPIHVQHIYT